MMFFVQIVPDVIDADFLSLEIFLTDKRSDHGL